MAYREIESWQKTESTESSLIWREPKMTRKTKISPYIYRKGHSNPLKQNDLSNELPFELKKAIEVSKQLLEYEDDWDGEGSSGYSKYTLGRAEKFLTDNALTFWKNNAVWVIAPDFCPGPDGSIDLLWKLEDRELLINIPVDENNLAGYYGDNFQNGSVIKGKLNLTEKNEWILMWLMK